MKLYGSLTSPFVRKVRIAIAEQAHACTFLPENPRDPGSHAQRLSPLGKVPVLELDDGTALVDSRVILEYLDAHSTRPLVPSVAQARWTTLRLQALGDGLLESIIKVWTEERRPEAERHHDVIAWEERRIGRALAALDAEPKHGSYFLPELGLADIVTGVALEYLDFRAPRDWRAQHPALATWHVHIAARASFQATGPVAA